MVAARFGGSQAVVEAARDKSAVAARSHNSSAVEFADDVIGVWRAINNIPAQMREAQPDAIVLRAGVPPKELDSLVRAALSIAYAQSLATPIILAHAASAVTYLKIDASETRALEFIRQLRINIIGLRGHLYIESGPKSLKDELGAWEPIDGAPLRLIRAIKKQFDPNNILNPGRFAGGI